MKLNLTFTLFLSLILFQANAQRPKPDKLETKNGTVTIQPIQHGTLVLTWNKKTIYVDPYGGAEAFSGLAAPDLILITDIHPDHLELKTLNGINTSKAKIVAPKAVGDSLPEVMKKKTTILSNGAKTNQFGIEIKAMPMYNLPESADSKHPKGRGNGYLLSIGDKTIYISGDTHDIKEMRSLKNIDVAFVCMNPPYTMDIHQAAAGVLAFKPKVVYPYHYRSPEGLNDVEAFKQEVTKGNKNIEVRLRNWYPEK